MFLVFCHGQPYFSRRIHIQRNLNLIRSATNSNHREAKGEAKRARQKMKKPNSTLGASNKRFGIRFLFVLGIRVSSFMATNTSPLDSLNIYNMSGSSGFLTSTHSTRCPIALRISSTSGPSYI